MAQKAGLVFQDGFTLESTYQNAWYLTEVLTLFIGGVGDTREFAPEMTLRHLHAESLLGSDLGINSSGVVRR